MDIFGSVEGLWIIRRRYIIASENSENDVVDNPNVV